MRIGTWNIQGMTTKKVEIFKELAKYNMDIIALPETKKKGKGAEETNGYIHIYSGVPIEERGQSGISLAIKKKYKKCIKSWEQVSDRILQVQMEVMGRVLVVIAVYAPNEDAVAAKKDTFFNELTGLLEIVSDRKEKILLGDFNGRVGWKLGDPIVGPHGENVTNSNGERLIELCHQHNLRITNGFFKHKNIHRYTWTQPTRNLRTVIDYVVVQQQTKLKTMNVRVMRGPECGSDHYLLLSKIYFPYKTNIEPQNTRVSSKDIEEVRYNLQGLKDESIKFLYQIRLAAKLAKIEDNDANRMYEEIKMGIHEAAHEALGKASSPTVSRNDTPWWDERMQELVDDKKKAYMKWLETQTAVDLQSYRHKRKEVQRAVAKSKNESWQKSCEEIEQCRGNTRANKAWKILNGLRLQTKDKAGMSLIDMEVWKAYYEKLLTEDRNKFVQPTVEEEGQEGYLQITPISPEEVNKAVARTKNGKSPGPGNISNELLKAAPMMLMEKMAKLFDNFLKGDTVPKEWKFCIITSVYKKSNRQDCRNYRGISVICSVARLYGKLVKSRLERQSTELEEQNGFRAGRSCIDGIFTLRNLIEKRVARNRPVHLTFIDLQKAYDTVPLSKLWTSMGRNGICELYINAVKALYCGCSSVVKVGRKLSEEFQVSKGLRQGCPIAPTLFKIYLEEVLKGWKQKCKAMGIPVGDETLFTLLFADDQVIVAGDIDDSSYMVRKLITEYEKWGLTINITKTEYLVIGEENREDLDLENMKIRYCKDFKYLGVTFSEDGKSTTDIKNKIAQGRRVIRQLNSVLWSDKVTKKTKAMIYKSIVESIATYGSETWEMTKRDREKLLALEMDFWRRSCGISRLDHVRNETIRELMGVEVTTIVDTIDTKQLSWYGHLERMSDQRWPKRMLQWNPPERKKRGRPPRRWDQGIQEAMTARGLQQGDWENRKMWKLRSEKRRQP